MKKYYAKLNEELRIISISTRPIAGYIYITDLEKVIKNYSDYKLIDNKLVLDPMIIEESPEVVITTDDRINLLEAKLIEFEQQFDDFVFEQLFGGN